MALWTTIPLRGPNRWSSAPTLELHTESSLATEPVLVSHAIADSLQSFLDQGRFTTTHPESIPEAKRLVSVVRRARNRAELWISLARWLSAMSGVPTRDFDSHLEDRSKFCEMDPSDSKIDCGATVLVMAMEMEEPLLSERCYSMAEAFIEQTLAGETYPIGTKFRELFDYADDVRLGPSSRAILDAATSRGIPYWRLTSGSLVQLGEGFHQRRIWTAETDATSAIAESIASDKDLTKRLLRNVGVPVPLGRMVLNAEDAWTAAGEVGFPVVVKPRDANHQRGISIELTEREEILKAYEWAIHDGQTQDVMVEQFARGQHHRLLVVGDRMVAASRGHVETVTGDGIRTIVQLVEELNSDPRRGEAYTDPLGIIKLEAAAQIELTKQQLTIDSVPESGRIVLISRTGDLTTDCTEAVHPLTAAQAVLAARVVGLDVAGLDVLAIDISKPLAEQRGAVVEVNAGPSLTPHVSPLFGPPRNVGQAIVDMLFPPGRESRVEIIGVLDGSQTAESSHPSVRGAIDSIMAECRAANRCVGIVRRDGIEVDGVPIDLGLATSRERAAAVLGHPGVQCVIVEIDSADAMQHGLCVSRFDRLLLIDVDETFPNRVPVRSSLTAVRNAMSPRCMVTRFQ